MGFLFACLLWNPVYRRWLAIQSKGERPIPALHEAIEDVVDGQLDALAIQRRYVSDLREIWLMQPRFEKRGGVIGLPIV